MNAGVLIMIIVGLGACLWAIRCASNARNLSRTSRVVAGVTLLPILAFSTFGWMAAHEPGEGHIYWQIGYAAVGILTLVSTVWLAIAGSSEPA